MRERVESLRLRQTSHSYFSTMPAQVLGPTRPTSRPSTGADTGDQPGHPPRRRPDGALFTSTCVPPSPGLAGSCQLPFGCVISSLAPLRQQQQQQQAQHAQHPPTACQMPVSCAPDYANESSMAICLSCLSYLNPYCPYDVGTGRWTCSICGYEDNATDPTIFDTSSPGRGIAVVPNAVEYVQRAAGARDRPGRCCYVFVLDGNIPPAEIRSALRTIRSLFEGHDGAHSSNKHATVGLIVYGKTVSIYQLGLSAGMASADIYSVPQSATVADGAFEQAMEQDDIGGRSYLESVSSGGLDALERCSDAFFDFDADVEEGGAGASVLASTAAAPLSNSGAPSSRREFLKKRREERLRREALAAKGGLAVQGQQSSTSTSVPKRVTSRQMRRKRRLDRERRRCTGTAVQLAINLILAADDNVDSTSSGESTLSKQNTCRIILFTNGCPNHGPGSVVSPLISSTDGSNTSSVSSAASLVSSTTSSRKGSPRQQRRRAGNVVDPVALAEASEYYHLLGKDAFEAGIGIDIFCSGATSLGVPALQALVGPSDGYIVIHESLSLDAFSANFRHAMTKTHMSRARDDRDHDGLLNARDESALNKLNGVILDVRTSW